jgi:hypothetical protein
MTLGYMTVEEFWGVPYWEPELRRSQETGALAAELCRQRGLPVLAVPVERPYRTMGAYPYRILGEAIQLWLQGWRARDLRRNRLY